ncbi:MAG: GIY-YIG nuclease family protein [Candidatus Jettenia sp. CY-1]|nr:MAG: GIY-YIG nuclease family protein [Candidatus Jettenia sp. CY-1]
MRDKIYAYLSMQRDGISGKELVEQVLKIKGAPVNVCKKLIQTAITGDSRFAVDKQGYWRTIERKGTSFLDAEFVFLSLLSIDTVDKPRIILEISAQKIRNNKILDQLHLLVNPGSSVITTLNFPGYLAQEIKGGLTTEKAARSLFHFSGDAVLVGYDVQSSIHQLNMILSTLHEGVENASLCLKCLTKKLIPDLQVRSLDDIAAYFKTPVVDNRRTENEISLIAEIFYRYRELLRERGLNTLEEVLEFQYPDIHYVDFTKYAFDKSFLWAIPQRPGIYTMKDKNGEVIYVGKAKNLNSRVSSYFWNTADRLQKITNVLQNIYTIEYEITGSELAAMLREYRLIKQYQPKLNQQIEVHERAARYGNLKNFILILPSLAEEAFELFFIKEGCPLQRYEILKGVVNFSEIGRILDKMYYNALSGFQYSNIEMGEIDIVLSWVEINKDQINYINMDVIPDKDACLKLLKDYIQDEEALRKHFRFS